MRHQASFHASLAILRRSTLSRICASLIVVLATSPFTAPFSASTLTDLTGEAASHEGSLVSSKILDDTSTVGIIAADLVIFTGELVLQSIEYIDRTDRRQHRITVLRL